MPTEKDDAEVFQMDDNTRELFELFPALNKRKLVNVEPYGELKDSVILAAISQGMKNHEVEFVWQEAKDKKKPEIKTTLTDDKIIITADKELLEQIEADVMKQISPELMAQVKDPMAYVTESLTEIKWGPAVIRGSGEVITAFAEAYRLYRQK